MEDASSVLLDEFVLSSMSLIKGMQKIQSGWLRDFISRGDLEVIIDEIEPNILTADEMNFELY